MWLIYKHELNDKFYHDIKKDINLLSDLKSRWDKVLKDNFVDPKFEKFLSFIKEKLKSDKKRKLLVFSEFADTADYLYESLSKSGIKVFKYTSADATKRIIEEQ